MNNLLLPALVISMIKCVWLYPQGAPTSTCLTMFPKHQHSERLSIPCPFTISLSSNTYTPGQVITVTISGAPEKTFRGIQIRAHRTKGDVESIMGQFTSYPENLVKTFNCFGGKDNMISHNSASDKTNLTMTWKAPDVPVGDLIFSATILATFKEFWIDQQSPVLVDALASNNLGSLQPVSNADPSINFDGCGDTKGCVMFPRHCSGVDCDAAVSFQRAGDYVNFELMGKAEGYVSVGFSHDALMKDDETLSCTAQNSRVTVQRGYNPALYNERQYTVGIVNMSTIQKDGKIFCRFSRPLVMEIVKVDYPKEGSPVATNVTFDLAQDWFIMLAWGYTYEDTDVVGKHDELPLVTSDKVSLSSKIIYHGSALSIWLKLHGCLAIVAWMLLVGLGTVIARHYRDGFGAKMLCGQKQWFQLHRSLVVLAFLCTAASFVLIFVSLKDWSKYAGVHIWLGIAIMAATLLQVFGGLIRPSPSSKIRPVFNWAHRLLGKATHIATAAEIYLGFNITLIPAGMRNFGLIVVIVWIASQVLWELVLEIVSCCKSRSSSQNDYDVSNQFKLEEKYPDETNRLAVVLLVLYLLTIVGVTASALCAILLY